MSENVPDEETMYDALIRRDGGYEGIFVAGVKTTGIFCRPSCTARKPKRENVEFFRTPKDALQSGYRPCRLCHPLSHKGAIPDWLIPLMDEIDENPDIRMKDRDIRERGIDPNRVRRWFREHHGMTFQAYLRSLRIGKAFGQIKYGDKVIDAAFDSGYESLSGFSDSFRKSTGFSPAVSPGKELITVTRILTPLGPMIAGAVKKGICLLEFTDRKMIETQLKKINTYFSTASVPGEHPHFKSLDRQLKEYFDGSRREFSVPLVYPGTEFQMSVWKALQTIPYGTTRSYGEQARLLGKPKAVRAVARANGANRIGIIIPCHRVIGSDGNLVGYGGGLWRKKYLLNLERKNLL